MLRLMEPRPNDVFQKIGESSFATVTFLFLHYIRSAGVSDQLCLVCTLLNSSDTHYSA